MIKRPILFIVFCFLAAASIGAGLLWLPISAVNGTHTDFLDAYFTANSATCATNLNTLDIGSHFSFFGKMVIMLLIQIGGLSYMAFSTFMVLFFRKRMFISEKTMLQETLNIYSKRDVFSVLRKIFILVFAVEGIGSIILFLRWLPEFGIKKALLWGIFHSISAFCNAGFALPNGFANLMAYRTDLIINLTVTSLSLIGGLGFLVITDIFYHKRFSLQSKIVISTSLILIFFAALFIFLMEYDNSHTIGHLSLGGKILVSYFQAVSPRTSGFYTIPIDNLYNSTLVLMMALMFIGASPGGTGGGIKITTLRLILATLWSTLKNQKNTIVLERRIPPETVRKAFVIFILSIVCVGSAIFMLNGTENFGLTKITFEAFSAFSNTGLSMGITPYLSSLGKIILIVLMLIGRIGALSLLMGLSSEEISKSNIKYPKEGISIG